MACIRLPANLKPEGRVKGNRKDGIEGRRERTRGRSKILENGAERRKRRRSSSSRRRSRGDEEEGGKGNEAVIKE